MITTARHGIIWLTQTQEKLDSPRIPPGCRTILVSYQGSKNVKWGRALFWPDSSIDSDIWAKSAMREHMMCVFIGAERKKYATFWKLILDNIKRQPESFIEFYRGYIERQRSKGWISMATIAIFVSPPAFYIKRHMQDAYSPRHSQILRGSFSFSASLLA